MRRSNRTAALLLCTLSAPVAVAAQLPDSIPPRFNLRGFIIPVPRLTSTTGGPSAIELRLDSMAPIPAPTLEQVLRSMPLVVIRQNSRGESQPALRGSEDRQIAIMMDGIPLTLGWDHRTDLSIVPLTAAQEIRLTRGLSSVLHGPNVLGGVVEVDVARGAARQTEPVPLIASLSVDHTGARAVGLTIGRLFSTDRGEWVVRAGGGYQERSGLVLPGGLAEDPDQRARFLAGARDRRLNSDVERYDAFLAARYQKDNGTWLSFSSSGYTSERGAPPESHIDDPRLWRYPEADRLIMALSGGTGERVTPWGEGDLEFSLGVDFGRTEIDQFETEGFEQVVGEEDGDDRTVSLRLLGDHSLGEEGEARVALTFADVSHDERLDRIEFNEYEQRLWSLGGEVERVFGGFFGIPGLGSTRVSLGAAVDGADTPKSGDKPPLGTLWDWGARLGFTSLVSGESARIHGGVSRRVRFPALRELYSGALGRFEPNPNLRPETLTGGEIGFTTSTRAIELQVVGFYQRLTDGIVRTTVVVDDESKFQRVNRDRIRSLGLELLSSATLGPLSLSGDLTLQDVKGRDEDGASVDLEYEPSVVGKLNAGFPLPEGMTGSAGLRFVGEQRCENPEMEGLDSFDTDPSLDLSLSRSFVASGRDRLSRIEAVLSVQNVGDAAVFDQCGLPQPGRTFQLQLRLW